MKTRIAVYGSLLSGLGNHRVLGRYLPEGKAVLVGTDKIMGFDLYAVSSFPGIKRNPQLDKTVVVEVYDVDDEALSSVRSLEGYRPGANNTFYDEVIAPTVKHDSVAVYLYMPPIDRRDHVPSGDWRPHRLEMDSRNQW